MFPYVWMLSYDEKDEESGGLYWQFLDNDVSEIKSNITFSTLIDIFQKIKNPELREKMKIKIQQTIEFSDFNTCYKQIKSTNLLTDSEIFNHFTRAVDNITIDDNQRYLDNEHKNHIYSFYRFYWPIF